MHNKWFNKLWSSSKQWFLRVVWSRVRTRKALSLTFLILVIAMSVCPTLRSWTLDNAEFLMFLVLAIGLYFAYAQFKIMNKNNQLMKITEQARLINSMSIYWDSEIMRQGRKALAEIEIAGTSTLSDELENSRKEKDFEKFIKLTRVGNFFEEMGNLAYDQAIDLPLIAGRFRTEIIERYKDYEPFIDDNKQGQPTVYEYFKWLAEEIKKIKM